MRADLTWLGLHDGLRSSRSAAAPATWGAEKLVPSRTAKFAPAKVATVEERMLAPGRERLNGIAPASPGWLSTTTTPSAPAAAARAPFVSNRQPPLETSAIRFTSELAGSVSAQRVRSTGRPFVPTIAPTSTSVWLSVPQAGGVMPGAATYGICRRLGTAGERTLRAGVKTCALVTAATLIASGAVLGEPTVPNPKRSRSLPAEITGTTPAFATLATAAMSASDAGSACVPPPEKLITSIPSATAASNAAAISGVFATQQSVCVSGSFTEKTR